MTIANLLEYADAAINLHAVVIVVVLVAAVLILAVWLIRERSAARESADLHGRVVTLESRIDAIDSLLVGLLTTLMKSQSPSDVSGRAVENISTHLQELEYELQALRNQESTSQDITIAKGRTEKIATTEAGVSTEEYKIGNLLRRLATI